MKTYNVAEIALNKELFNKRFVCIDDIKEYLETYKEIVDDYHSSDYFVKEFIDELSQSTDKELNND